MEDSTELVVDCWFTVIMPEEYSHIESEQCKDLSWWTSDVCFLACLQQKLKKCACSATSAFFEPGQAFSDMLSFNVRSC
jgi:hypothetical protein